MKASKKAYALAAALCAAICLTGCFSLDTAKLQSTGEELIHVGNNGWYLFHFIPLACGNAAEDPALPWALFRNDVTMDKVQHRFMEYAKFYGKNPHDMSYYTQETVLFSIPGTGTNFPFPIPYVLTYREVQLSGVLK